MISFRNIDVITMTLAGYDIRIIAILIGDTPIDVFSTRGRLSLINRTRRPHITAKAIRAWSEILRDKHPPTLQEKREFKINLFALRPHNWKAVQKLMTLMLLESEREQQISPVQVADAHKVLATQNSKLQDMIDEEPRDAPTVTNSTSPD